MTTPAICTVEPFRYQATPQPIDEHGASSNQINEQSLEDYLNRMRVALCADIQALVDNPPSGVDEFIELLDTPDTYVGQEGKIPAVNSAEDALEFFPSSFAAQAGKMVVVNGTEDGFALQTQPTISTYFLTPRLISMWNPNPAAQVFGPLPTVVGAGQIQIPVNPTNALTANYRQRFTTGVGANAVAGIRSIVFLALVGSASPMGGFRLRWRFGLEGFTAGHRCFIGLSPNAAAFPSGAVDPSTLVNIVALAFDDTDTNWQIMQNDAAGAATKTDLGAGFAMNTTSLLELTLEVEPSGSDVNYTLRNLSLGTQTSGTVNGNLPAGGQPLGLSMQVSAAATGVVAAIAHIFMSLEVGPGE